MKALTICQPYAELICRGKKRIENRMHRRFQGFRGPLLIHSGHLRGLQDPPGSVPPGGL